MFSTRVLAIVASSHPVYNFKTLDPNLQKQQQKQQKINQENIKNPPNLDNTYIQE